jgi:hypothetical protein
MKHESVTLTALVLFTAWTTASGPAKQATGETALNKRLGTWTSQIEFKPAAWSLQARELSGTVQAEWILSDRYQQISRNPSSWLGHQPEHRQQKGNSVIRSSVNGGIEAM